MIERERRMRDTCVRVKEVCLCESERERERERVKGGYLRVVKVINKLKLTETLPHLPKEKSLPKIIFYGQVFGF